MLKFVTLITFVNSITYFVSILAVSSTPPPPPLINCGNNEVATNCENNLCLRKYCIEPEPKPDCKFEDKCQLGCVCREGYLRAMNGTCIPKDKCPEPMVCGQNEEYTDCVGAGCSISKCSEFGRWERCRSLFPAVCIPGCVCKYDYLLAANGTCVPTKECPSNEFCSRPHEYYDPCPPDCPARYCGSYVSEGPCPPQPELGDPSCYPSCRCKEGFYANQNNYCVPREDCSKYCFGLNEYFDGSPETCEPQTCDSISNATDQVLQSSNTTCKGECRCIHDYVRNKHGECIAKENCDKCQGPNEHFACKKLCDNVCATLHKVNQNDCVIKNIYQCVNMCYCDDGYARDSNNICIPISDCPNK